MAEGNPSRRAWLAWLEDNQGIILPTALLCSLIVFVVPLPPAVMDLLLTLNISLSVLIFLSTLNVRTPLEFSVFPTILLSTTVFRLVLNVATTRLILVNGASQGSYAAGHVVRAFGEFVAGGNLVLGVLLFVILNIVQLLVINSGSVRTSEVAARFALDGMPGRQMAIDADLNAGLIDNMEAKRRREEIARQADFYGAMDGAGKFVRGDAIASLIITAINILGGLAVGVFYHGMEFSQAGRVFTTLTIGDGLVSQMPAMLLSLAAGFLVTRQSISMDLGKQLNAQLFGADPQTLRMAGVFLGLLALSGFATGLPILPLGGASALCFWGARQVGARKLAKAVAQTTPSVSMEKPVEKIEEALRLDPLELEIGVGLLPLADLPRGGDLDERINLMRRSLASDLGLILPAVRLRENSSIAPHDYFIRLKGNVIATWTVSPYQLLALDTGMTTSPLPGEATTEPLFEQTAYWIEPTHKDRAENLGYTVITPTEALIAHLSETIKRYAGDLLSRERVSQLIATVKESAPQVVAEVVPEVLKVGEVQRVLQNLLRENVPIRDLESILETLGDYGAKVKDLDILTEYVRHRLSRTICQRLRGEDRTLRVVTLDPALEDMIAAGIERGDRTSVKLSPMVVETISRAIAEQVKELTLLGKPAVVLVGPQVRSALKAMTAPTLPNLVALSYNEVTRDTRIESIGMVRYPAPQRPLPA